VFHSKNRPIILVIMVALALAWITGSIAAQEPAPEATPEPTPEPPPYELLTVTVEASDGLPLVGDYIVPPGSEYGPVVILIHQLYTNNSSWTPIIGPLWANGYRILAVDVRGAGRTRGAINWAQAQDDTLTWLDWLYGQPGVQLDAVHLVGSSMGANLALVGCAAAAHCNGVVAISPGLHYYGVYTEGAITSGIPALVVYAERDYYPARDVPLMEEKLAELELNSMTTMAYPGNAHGVDLFAEEELIPAIIGWLNQ
jgi:dienelactone hydrolase